MPRKIDDSRQIHITFTSTDGEKVLDGMDKLQTEISGIKQTIGCISADLKKLTVSVQTLQIAVDRLLKDKH